MPTWDDPNGPLWDDDDAVWDFDPKRRRVKMTKLQIDDVLGFGSLLRAAATEHKAALIAKEYDPTAKIASTATASGALSDSKAQAKTAHIAAEAKTKVTEDLKQAYYDSLTSWCDMLAGTLGKSTPEGKAILAIRANLTGTGPQTPATPPTPPAP